MSRETPLHAEQERLGASFGTFFGCALPARYTELAKERRLAREGVAVFDTNYHVYLALTGPDRVRYLNAIVTNNIQGLAAGQGAIALLLNPQGHILAELECYTLRDKLLITTYVFAGERTQATLEKFIIMDDVTLENQTGSFSSVGVEGPQASALMKELCGVDLDAMQEFAHSEVKVQNIPWRVIRRSRFGEPGAEIVLHPAAVSGAWRLFIEAARDRRGGPVGYEALNSLRLEAGIPWFGYDFDETVIPHEAGLETSHISYDKGCYTGQEIVERVRSRGHVNRRRVRLEFSGTIPPERGTKLMTDDKEAGHVTSAAFSPRFGRAIGMGYLRQEQAAPGTEVRLEGGTAKVIPVLSATSTPAPR